MATFYLSMDIDQRITDIANRLFALDSTELTVFSTASFEQKISNILSRIELLEIATDIEFVDNTSMTIEQRVIDLLERIIVLENNQLNPPAGFNFIVNADGHYITNGDGAYLLSKENS